MSITYLLIILGAVVLLFIVSKSIRKKSSKSGQSEGEKPSSSAVGEITDTNEIPGEVLAAIFMALHEDQEVVHDVENTVLTLEPVIRNYSPWNSKFYGLRELPRR